MKRTIEGVITGLWTAACGMCSVWLYEAASSLEEFAFRRMKSSQERVKRWKKKYLPPK